VLFPEYNRILKPLNGVVFVNNYGMWGAYGLPGHNMPDTYQKWNGIDWDGKGGYVVTRRNRDGNEAYHIINGDTLVTCDLTEMPERFDHPDCVKRETSYWERDDHVSFRVTKKGENYGLVKDIFRIHYDNSTYSELVLEPEYTREQVIESAKKAGIEEEVKYYAFVVLRTPKYAHGQYINVWENIPNDLHEKVRGYMKTNDWEQPEDLDSVIV
jgi:hypothetical protein